MDGFYGNSGAGSGPWKPYKISGSVGFDLAPYEGVPGPSVHLKSTNSSFDAGIRQTVQTTPGTGYIFKVGWAVEQVDGKGWQDWYQINRRLGIDPFGGTDPNSANVQWSPDYFRNGKFDLAFNAYAQASSMTVFIRVSNPYPDHVVDVYLDAAGLKEDTSMPPITAAAPAPTQPSATEVPPTAKPTREPTAVALAPTETEVPVDASTPTEIPVAESATETPESTATTQPTETPAKTPTRVRRPTPIPTIVQETTLRTGAFVAIGATGLIGVGLAGGLFGLAIYYWFRSRKP